ncbi:hypothetical protein HYU13_06805 [Candidatus Woesearchaeota archaeon]|nr:hypothetical protein [Candidatus Woesearchaeota archaeon]
MRTSSSFLKKTSDAIGGDIAGFGDDYVVVTPSFAQVYRARSSSSAASGQQGSQMQPQEIKLEEEAV